MGFFIDGIERTPSGYSDENASGAPCALTYWVNGGLDGVHELRIDEHLQGVRDMTVSLAVEFRPR